MFSWHSSSLQAARWQAAFCSFKMQDWSHAGKASTPALFPRRTFKLQFNAAPGGKQRMPDRALQATPAVQSFALQLILPRA
jgi:hypothetical protein